MRESSRCHAGVLNGSGRAAVVTTTGAGELTVTTGARSVRVSGIARPPDDGESVTLTAIGRGIGYGRRQTRSVSARLTAARGSAPGTAWTLRTMRPCT